MKSGFSGTVNLSVTGLPAGAHAKFTPPSLTKSGTSILTILTTSTTPTGTYPLVITGTTGGLIQTANATLVVNVATNDFTVSASPNSVTIDQISGVGTSTVIVTSQNNFSGPVTLSATGMAPGVSAAFSPNPVTPAADGGVTSLMTLTELTWPAPYGTFPVIVTGTSSYQVATANLSLTVLGLPYVLSASDANVILEPGNSATIPLFVAGSASYTSPVTLSANGLPSDVTAVFSPNPVTMQFGWGPATLTLTASPTATTGTFPFSVTATSGSFTQTLTAPSVIVSTSGFTVGASPATVTLKQGLPGSSTITLTSQNGFSGTVYLSAAGLPDGASAVFTPSSAVTVPANGSGSVTLNLYTDTATSIGAFPISVTGTIFEAGSFLANTATVSLTVQGANQTTFVTLTSALNRIGVFPDGLESRNVTRGLDGNGLAYSEELLGAWSGSWNNTRFSYTIWNYLVPDAVSGAGQIVPLPQGKFSALRMLGTGVNGNQAAQTFTVTYTDGATTTITQSLSDWKTPQNYSGESRALKMAYVDDTFNGGRIPRPIYLYGYSFAIDKKRTVASVTMPNNVNVEVLAMTLVP